MQPRKLRRTGEQSFKLPEGMYRELYALLYSDSRSVEICFDGVVVDSTKYIPIVIIKSTFP